ncbi:MAG: alpha/beta fold hydrolase [Candidatus Roizmanbacteria bacterium]|nr:alpha/beta fold hydrolase [Candidatus Roizmanbacteria bacterium]
MKKLAALFIIFVLALFLWITQNSFVLREQLQNNTAVQRMLPTPTPLPFVEMTIPYLREREYYSQLYDRQEVADNGTYRSYLTSYESDGFRINGLLTIPTEKEPNGGWPAIIFIHGYIPPMQYDTLTQYASYVDYLARQGFVVFKIDLRGHAQSEGEPGGGYYGSDYIVDTLHAYSALQNSGFVHPKRIGLWGHSMAGNVLLRSFVVQQDIPAIVIWAGAVYSYEDWQKYGIEDNSYRPLPSGTPRASRRQQLFDTYGEFNKDSVFWQQVTPVNYLSGVSGAIQLHHAVDDAVVTVGYSRDLMNILDATSITHELHEYQSGGHNISGASFETAMQNTIRFYNQYLK